MMTGQARSSVTVQAEADGSEQVMAELVRNDEHLRPQAAPPRHSQSSRAMGEICALLHRVHSQSAPRGVRPFQGAS